MNRYISQVRFYTTHTIAITGNSTRCIIKLPNFGGTILKNALEGNQFH